MHGIIAIGRSLVYSLMLSSHMSLQVSGLSWYSAQFTSNDEGGITTRSRHERRALAAMDTRLTLYTVAVVDAKESERLFASAQRVHACSARTARGGLSPANDLSAVNQVKPADPDERSRAIAATITATTRGLCSNSLRWHDVCGPFSRPQLLAANGARLRLRQLLRC